MLGRAVSRANFIPGDRYERPKNIPKKQPVKLLTLTCLLLKRKLNYPWKDNFHFLTLISTKLRNTLAQNSLDKLMQLTSMEPHTYDLDRGEVTDLHKFLKKPHRVVLS